MRIITWNCPGEFDIDQFGSFDLFFVQRMCGSMVSNLHYHKNYIENYSGRGICVVSKEEPEHIESGEFSWYNETADETQGKHWQTFTTNNIKFINALPSYPEDDGGITDENRILQTSELLDLVDYNSVLVGDFHENDNSLEEEIKLENRGLINHIKEGTFTCNDGSMASIDKIITTKNSDIKISNVTVIKYERERLIGHWPISFDLEIS